MPKNCKDPDFAVWVSLLVDIERRNAFFGERAKTDKVKVDAC